MATPAEEVKENPVYVSKSGFTRRQWAILVVFCFAYLFAACATSLQAPFYPAEAERKGATATEYGLVFGIYQLVVFIMSPVFGKYINNCGPKLVFNVGLLTMGTSCLLFGFLDKVDDHILFITLSLVIRIVEAVGGAGFMTSSFTIIAGEFPNSVGTTFASLETFFGLGLIIGPSIGGVLYEVGGFLLPFAVTGVFLATVALITPLLMPRGNAMSKSSGEIEGFGLLSILKVPAAALCYISIWMSSNSVGFLNATLEPHLRQFHFSEMRVGLVFMITGGSYAISAPLWGKLMDKRCEPKSVALFGCLLIIVSHLIIGPAVFIPVETIFYVTCIGLVIHGIGVGAIQVAGFILALRDSIMSGFPDNLATYSVVSGLWGSSLSLGLFTGPSLGGLLLDYGSFRLGSLYPLGAAIIVLGLVLAFLVYDHKQKLQKRGGSQESAQLLSPGTIPRSRRISHEYRGAFTPSSSYGTM